MIRLDPQAITLKKSIEKRAVDARRDRRGSVRLDALTREALGHIVRFQTNGFSSPDLQALVEFRARGFAHAEALRRAAECLRRLDRALAEAYAH